MTLIDQNQSFDAAMSWIENASAILVIAGAGMSDGLEIPANEGWGNFPKPPDEDVVDWHLRYGNNFDRMWGMEGMKLLRMVVRGTKLQNPGYERLFNLLKYRNHFIWTSNIDHRFQTAGFAVNRVYTPQGDITLLQCSTPCSGEPAAWHALDPLLALTMSGAIDHDSHTVRSDVQNRQFMPTCPNCGAPAYKHTRHNKRFTHRPHDETQQRLVDWLLQHATDCSDGPELVILELGCGLSTPWTNRFPAESMARQLPARLIRVNINEGDAQVPSDLVASKRAVSLVASIDYALLNLSGARGYSEPVSSISSPIPRSQTGFSLGGRLERVPFAHPKIKWTAYLDKLRDPEAKPSLL